MKEKLKEMLKYADMINKHELNEIWTSYLITRFKAKYNIYIDYLNDFPKYKIKNYDSFKSFEKNVKYYLKAKNIKIKDLALTHKYMWLIKNYAYSIEYNTVRIVTGFERWDYINGSSSIYSFISFLLVSVYDIDVPPHKIEESLENYCKIKPENKYIKKTSCTSPVDWFSEFEIKINNENQPAFKFKILKNGKAVFKNLTDKSMEKIKKFIKDVKKYEHL